MENKGTTQRKDSNSYTSSYTKPKTDPRIPAEKKPDL